MLTRWWKSLKYVSAVTHWANQLQKPSALKFFKNQISTDNLCGFFKLRTLSFANKLATGYSCTSNESLKWRVWSWLRLNAGGRPNTCKSNGNSRGACSFGWRVADGWVIPGNLPDSGGQQLETTANTACSLRGKEEIRYQMSPGGIS